MLLSEVLSEWVSGWAPFSRCLQPLQYCCQGGGPHLQGNGIRKQPTRCSRQPGGGNQEGGPGQALTCLPQRPVGRGWVQKGEKGAQLAQIQDGAMHAESPVSRGTVLGDSNSG